MKITQSPTPGPVARSTPEATPPEVLAYESTQDQVTLYGEDGKPLAGSEVKQRGGDGFVKKLLLPSKMPEAVSPDYLKSRKWHFLGEVAGSMQSYLGTNAALSAVGVGSGPLTVGLAWMVRDGIDGVGKFVGSQFGRQADRDPKGWYMRGEYFHATGMLMESALSVVPGAFLAVAPAANAVKAFGSTMRGAATAPIEVHQARDNNLAEVRTKNANQDMLAGVLGGGAAFGLEKIASASIGPVATPLMMAAATATKIFATYQYTRALDLDPVTEKRVHEHVRKWLEIPKGSPYPRNLENLTLGAELKTMVANPERFKELTGLYAGKQYLLDIQGDDLNVVFSTESKPEDQLQAVAQASLIRLLQASPGYKARVASEGEGPARDWVLRTSLAAVPHVVENFARDEDDPLRFLADKRRAHWEPGEAVPLEKVDKARLLELLNATKV